MPANDTAFGKTFTQTVYALADIMTLFELFLNKLLYRFYRSVLSSFSIYSLVFIRHITRYAAHKTEKYLRKQISKQFRAKFKQTSKGNDFFSEWLPGFVLLVCFDKVLGNSYLLNSWRYGVIVGSNHRRLTLMKFRPVKQHFRKH